MESIIPTVNSLPLRYFSTNDGLPNFSKIDSTFFSNSSKFVTMESWSMPLPFPSYIGLINRGKDTGKSSLFLYCPGLAMKNGAVFILFFWIFCLAESLLNSSLRASAVDPV
jgi:hypothetical protein